jgi:trk system potassium uptake protein TrkH
MQLYSAEGHTDRLVPNLLESARVAFLIYSGFILGGTVLYVIFGMDWFDAINHSIARSPPGASQLAGKHRVL